MKRYTKGFTLIELLVVIAIIGILASVVLVSLQSARKKGNDARVISSVNQIRTALETEYNGSTYASLSNAGAPAALAERPLFSANIETLIADILTQQASGGLTAAYGLNSSVVITKDVTVKPGKGYAIYAKLPSDANKVFCIDGLGKTRNDSTLPVNAPANDAAATTCQ